MKNVLIIEKGGIHKKHSKLSQTEKFCFKIEHSFFDALKLINSNSFPVDFVFMRNWMLGVDAYKFFDELKKKHLDICITVIPDDFKQIVNSKTTYDSYPAILCFVEQFEFDKQKKTEFKTENKIVSDENKMLIDNNIDGIVITDMDGFVKYVNNSAEVLLNRRAEDLLDIEFGFPVITNGFSEINIVNRKNMVVTVEMRASEIELSGKKVRMIYLRDITNIVNLREELRLMSITDDLTGLYNRRGFKVLAEKRLKRFRRILTNKSKNKIMFFYLDIDDLKQINDEYGHNVGNSAILLTRDVLLKTFRDSDIIGRLGGDEFAILAQTSTKTDMIINRLTNNVKEYNLGGKHCFKLSLSAGAVEYDIQKNLSIDEILIYADKLMYKQKKQKHKERYL